MSSHRSALIALALVASAVGCRRDRDVRVSRAPAMEPRESGSTNIAADAPTAPAATVGRRQSAETSEAPPVTRTPAPQPPPRPSPPVVIVQSPPPPPAPPATVVIVQQPPAPSGPQAAPIVASPYAPTAPAYINDAGITVPAVPLYIDPSAPPGAPGNGAPTH